MRLSAIAAVVAAAGMAQVAAVPIRVIMVSSIAQDAPSNIRFGHAAVEQPSEIAKNMGISRSSGRMRTPCNGRMNRFRQKSIKISNAFRQALGWPLIETNAHMPTSGRVAILPVNHDQIHKLIPDEPIAEFWRARPSSDDGPHHAGPHHGDHHRGPHHGRIQYGGPRKTFIHRLHVSLMNLGLWEGRAVAFVLGCGIGVLLRMFWVLAIVAFRVVKRRSPDADDEYTHIVMFEAAEPVPAPPAYIVDEKVAVEEETKPAEATEAK